MWKVVDFLFFTLEANIILNFLEQDISFYDKDPLSQYTKIRSVECCKRVSSRL